MAMDQILKVIFQGDSRGLSSSLRNVQGELKNFGATATRTFGGVQTAFAALGVTLSAGALATGFKRIIDSMDALNDASKRLGISTESLSALGYAAEQSGASLEELQTGLKFLNRSLVEAQQGNRELAVVLRRFGITALDDTETALMKLADGFAAMPDGAQKTAAALKVLGRSGTALIPLLNEGSAGLAKFRKEAERLGIVISGEAAKAADEFNDALNRLGNEARGVGISLAGPVVGAMQDLIIQFDEGRKAAGGFWAAIFKFGLKANDPGAQINRLLENRKKLQDSMPALPSEFDPRIEQIEEINKELEYWRALQRRENEKLYAEEYRAADAANKKILASTTDRAEKELAQIEKLRAGYLKLSESIAQGAADAKAGAGKPLEESSVLDINRLRDQAKTLLESGNAADTKAALAALQQAQKINDNLLATGQITKQYYLTQAELLLKLAQTGEQVAETEVGIQVGIDQDASLAAAKAYADLSQQFWQQNPAYQPVIPVLQQGITSANVGGTTDDGRTLISAAGITGRATGGLINGPGTGLSDSILARLSAGEFVVRAQAVKNYGLGFLERLNSMSLPRFAAGGPVGTPVNIYLPGGESFGVSAAPSVAKAMSRVLGLEVLKRGRR